MGSGSVGVWVVRRHPPGHAPPQGARDDSATCSRRSPAIYRGCRAGSSWPDSVLSIPSTPQGQDGVPAGAPGRAPALGEGGVSQRAPGWPGGGPCASLAWQGGKSGPRGKLGVSVELGGSYTLFQLRNRDREPAAGRPACGRGARGEWVGGSVLVWSGQPPRCCWRRTSSSLRFLVPHVALPSCVAAVQV